MNSQPVVPHSAAQGSESQPLAKQIPTAGKTRGPSIFKLLQGSQSVDSDVGGGSRSVGSTRLSTRAKRKVPKIPVYKWFPRLIVESRWFAVLTTLLTVYALTGDDIRLLGTDEPADIVFDCITLSCFVIFTLEILLSIMAKEDYFMSFFMVLDCLSTVTLILDLTLINNMILGDEEETSNVRGSQTAKIGARMTRIIRVMRLVRILKLYKAIYEANQAKKRREAQARLKNPGDDEDDWDDVELTVRLDVNRESLVGKKLSELTTRRVICLVLTMMLLHKLVRVDPSQQFKTSGSYGADVVSQALNRYMGTPSSESLRLDYENAALRFIYYHNWYAGQTTCPFGMGCPSVYDSHAFWMGIVGGSETIVAEKASLARIRPETVGNWTLVMSESQASADAAWLFGYGAMPPAVVQRLGEPWTLKCNTRSGATKRLGLSVIPDLDPAWNVNFAVRCPENLRRGERQKYFANVATTEAMLGEWHLAFYFDTRPFTYWESVFSLLVTFFICISLCVASVVFAGDANRLVLHPVENMIAKVETIRDNPLEAMKVADDDFNREEMTRAKTRKLEANKTKLARFKDFILCKGGKDTTQELMETVVLEKTIIKLGSLLALGFGQAGAQIIEHNMNGVDSACVDAMIDGTRVDCIIGATRIRDFGTATEVLQAKVMTFVNQIAEIVHGVVDEFHGYASKNNGDFFLMIWRKTATMDAARLAKLADMSMLAFTRILGAVHRSPVLANYRGHPGLQQRLGKNCRVNLSSGLHYGWAIEGAVGSEFKIDASYLSPNVNIAETVERATKIYGVSVLVAESVIQICTTAMAAKCRLIDRVSFAGASQPMELFVIDLDYMSLTVEPPPAMRINWTSRQRFRVRQHLELEKTRKWQEDVKMVSFFNENVDIAKMRFRYTLEFIHVFNMGYQNYSQGEWEVAHRLLTRTRTMLGVVDGPSLALLRYMEGYRYFAPKGWKACRELSQGSLL